MVGSLLHLQKEKNWTQGGELSYSRLYAWLYKNIKDSKLGNLTVEPKVFILLIVRQEKQKACNKNPRSLRLPTNPNFQRFLNRGGIGRLGLLPFIFAYLLISSKLLIYGTLSSPWIRSPSTTKWNAVSFSSNQKLTSSLGCSDYLKGCLFTLNQILFLLLPTAPILSAEAREIDPPSSSMGTDHQIQDTIIIITVHI